jgi:hypothetical protein
MFCGCRCLQRQAKRLASNVLFPSFKLGNNNLVKNMGLSAEQAMSVLEVPEAERQKFMDLLERQ